MTDLKIVFQYLKGCYHGNQYVKNGKLSSFVALAFWNGMGYRYLISCKNFVNFGPAPELAELICERLVRHG